MLNLPNWLIVYGTNRNSGKTTLITRIIRHFNPVLPIVGLKISPHFHALEDQIMVIERSEEFIIAKETNRETGKDSSRMLEAGADDVYYIQVWDNNLEQVIPTLLSLVKPGAAVICESGWARHIIEPGLFLILNRKGNTDIKVSLELLKPKADCWIEFDGTNFDFDPAELSFNDGCWKMGKKI
jgi:hypothetical protein